MRFYNPAVKCSVYTEGSAGAQGVDLSAFDIEFVTSTHLPQKRDGKTHQVQDGGPDGRIIKIGQTPAKIGNCVLFKVGVPMEIK